MCLYFLKYLLKIHQKNVWFYKPVMKYLYQQPRLWDIDLLPTSQVSIGFSPFLNLSATCFGIIWYKSSSVLLISSSSFLIDSSNFLLFCCSWSKASLSSTDCWVPANMRSLKHQKDFVCIYIYIYCIKSPETARYLD